MLGSACLRSFLKAVRNPFDGELWPPRSGAAWATSLEKPILASCILYIPAIVILQWCMRYRPPLQLKRALLAWNLTLSVLSFVGCLVGAVSQPILFATNLFDEADYTPKVRLVITIFTLTKCIEFCDTFFLIAKKRDVSFLHVYHHLTVTLYCLHAQMISVSFAHMFAFMNLFVHGIMYFYYALSVYHGSHFFLRRVRPLITLLQLLQMCAGMYLSIAGIAMLTKPEMITNAKLALTMYTSYAILFAHFYVKNYLSEFNARRIILVICVHFVGVVGLWLLYKKPESLRVSAEVLSIGCASLILTHVSTCKQAFIGRTDIPLKLKETLNKNCEDIPRGAGPRGPTERREMKAWQALVFMVNWVAGLGQKASRDAIDAPKYNQSESRVRKTCDVSKVEAATVGGMKSRLEESDSSFLLKRNIRGDGGESVGCNTGKKESAVYTTTKVCESNVRRKTFLSYYIRDHNPLRASLVDKALVIMGMSLPALYGWIRHSDALFGFCVYGALRWTLELQMADRLLFNQ